MLDILPFSASKENHIALSLGCFLYAKLWPSEEGKSRRDETQELDYPLSLSVKDFATGRR